MLYGLMLGSRVVASYLNLHVLCIILLLEDIYTSMLKAVIIACGRAEAIRERACLAVRQASAAGDRGAPKISLK